MMPDSGSVKPVFLDPYGRRARGWRRFWIMIGAIATVIGLIFAIGILTPPIAPALKVEHIEPFPVTPGQRERNAFRHRLAQVFRRAPPARKASLIPAGGGRLNARPRGPDDPIVVGFYVNWTDNSRASLNKHINSLDWVVGEWSFLSHGGDSVRLTVDRRVFDIARQIRAQAPPAFFIQVSNFDSATRGFSVPAVRAMLSNAAARARVINQLRNVVLEDSLAGVTIDFEDVPEKLQDSLVKFTSEMHAALAPYKRLVTQTVHAEAEPKLLRRLAAVDDYLFAMLFDEHFGRGDPGPIASQSFYEQRARAILSVVPPAKTLLMIGNYGYDWNDDPDTTHSGEVVTFQQVMAAARINHVTTHFDSVSLNPYVEWTEPDSTDHVIWYLDGATAFNQLRIGQQLGAAGTGILAAGRRGSVAVERPGAPGPVRPAGQSPRCALGLRRRVHRRLAGAP